MKLLLTILSLFFVVTGKSQTTITASYVSTTVNFSTGLTYITFAIRNNNTTPITLTNLSTIEVNLYENNVYTLWYSATSLSGIPTVASPVWTIAATSVQSFTPLAIGQVNPFDCIGLVIPPLTTYRFALMGTKGTAARGTVTPNIFSSGGVDLLVGNNTSTGGTVGYFGLQNTGINYSPYYFDGSITFAASAAYTDLQVSEIIKPTSVCASSSSSIMAKVCNKSPGTYNFSTSPINVAFAVTGPISQTASIPFSSGSLPPCGCINVAMGGVDFSAPGNYNLSATASIVSGPLTDANAANNTALDSIINYKPNVTPLIDSVCQYTNGTLWNGFTGSGCLSQQRTVTVNTLVTLPSPADGTSDATAALFAQGSLPALPSGAVITGGKLFITNLNATTTGTLGNEARFSIYSPVFGPVATFVPGTTGSPLNFAVINFEYSTSIVAAQLNNMYASLGVGGTFNVGYWESLDNATGASDVILNAQSLTTQVQLIIYYTMTPHVKWYTNPTGGSSFYSGSNMNPFASPGSGLNNTNTSGSYYFYAACSADSNCRLPLEIKIKPSPVVVQDSLAECEIISSTGNALFDLTAISGVVSAFNPFASVSYFQDVGLSLPILNPSSYIANTGYIYSKVEEAGCHSSDTIYLKVHDKPNFLPPIATGAACFPDYIDAVNLISNFSTTTLGTDTLYFADAAYSIPHPNPHLINTVDTVYMMFATNTTPSCKDSGVAYINVYPINDFIVNQDTTFNFSNSGSIACTDLTLTDGMQSTLRTTTDCSRIATITDLANGVSLGITSICEDIDATVQVHNTQPYVNRHYQITPMVNDSAIVCLYYLDDDLAQYNNYALSTWPNLPTAGNLSLTTNLCIAQTHNGDINTPGHTVTSIPNTAITTNYDTASTVWTLCFKVDSFSYFYLHSQNPLNIPLSAEIISFNATRQFNATLLEWITANEQNNSHFIVEHSADGKVFNALSGKIFSKAMNGNSQVNLNYSFKDLQPFQGHNYYKLKQFDIDGNYHESEVIDIYFANESSVKLYPNPFQDVLNVEINSEKIAAAKIKITDATGRTLRMIDLQLQVGNNQTQIDLESLSEGWYLISIFNNKGLNFTETVRRK